MNGAKLVDKNDGPKKFRGLDPSVEGARVLLLVGDGSYAANVVSAADHHQIARLELHMVHDLARLQV